MAMDLSVQIAAQEAADEQRALPDTEAAINAQGSHSP
jgi:hypothetical protein